MSYYTVEILRDKNGKPIPQYYDPVQDKFMPLYGAGGGAGAVLYGPDGNPIGVTGGRLQVDAQLTGSLMEIYKATVAERPAANSVPVGACFMAVNTGEIWQSNGTDWVEV